MAAGHSTSTDQQRPQTIDQDPDSPKISIPCLFDVTILEALHRGRDKYRIELLYHMLYDYCSGKAYFNDN